MEQRAKYKQSEIDEMGKKGEAFGPDADGHYSYPIADEEDLTNAIHAVGRGNADHDKLRKYIIGRAKALDLSDRIPDNWNADGTLKDAKANSNVEWRRRKAQELRGAERRMFALDGCELRESDDGMFHLSGYASVTDTPYDMGWYTESIRRGAFAKTLAENPDVQLLVNHAGLPLARTGRNMTLTEDGRGLKVEADLDAADPDVQALARKMNAGLIDQMSFAFRTIRQEWNEDYSDRAITELDLHRGDVSVVNQGANPATAVAIRSADAVKALQRIGPEGVAASLRELRQGMTLSAATMEVLTQVLSLAAVADDALDELQPLLADLMGVDNPDVEPVEQDSDDSDEDAPDDEGGDMGMLALPNFNAEVRARLEALRRRPRRDTE